MKQQRSVTSRNFLGSFLGGFLGMLAFGYIHAALLPFGVAFGVIIGWWYEDILAVISDSYRRSVRFGKSCWNFLASSAMRPVQVLRQLKGKFDIEHRIFIIPIACLIAALAWIFGRPVAFYRWLRAHQMNQAYSLRAAAVIAFLGLTALWLLPLVVWLIPETMGGGTDPMTGKPIPVRPTNWGEYVFAAFFSFVLVGMLPVVGLAASVEGRRGFYRTWERYSAKGIVRFFLQELAAIFHIQLLMFLALSAAVLYWTGLGLLFTALVVAPLIMFICAVRGIYQIAMCKGHWLCLSVTMAVTAVSAWTFSPYIGNSFALWSAAFLTGIASAIATEATRRGVAWLFTETKKGREYAGTEVRTFLKARLTPGWELILRGSEAIASGVQNLTPSL